MMVIFFLKRAVSHHGVELGTPLSSLRPEIAPVNLFFFLLADACVPLEGNLRWSLITLGRHSLLQLCSHY